MIFFFASAGASAAYLTVSEIFPVEVRAKAIAVFFAIAQCFGAFGPWFYGNLIGTGPDDYTIQALHRIPDRRRGHVAGGLVEAFLGVDAEQRPSRTSRGHCPWRGHLRTPCPASPESRLCRGEPADGALEAAWPTTGRLGGEVGSMSFTDGLTQR